MRSLSVMTTYRLRTIATYKPGAGTIVRYRLRTVATYKPSIIVRYRLGTITTYKPKRSGFARRTAMYRVKTQRGTQLLETSIGLKART